MPTLADLRRRARVALILRATGPWSRRPHPGQRYKHGWVPVGLAALTDDELLDKLRELDWDDDEFREALAESSRREREVWDRGQALLEERERLEQERERGEAEAAQRRGETRRVIESARLEGESPMRALSRAYAQWVAEQMEAAEAETLGHDVNERGRRVGVSAFRVFSNERDFERYASRELRDWREGNPDRWRTFAQWREQYAPTIEPGRRRPQRRSDTPRDQALPGLTGRPAGRSIRS